MLALSSGGFKGPHTQGGYWQLIGLAVSAAATAYTSKRQRDRQKAARDETAKEIAEAKALEAAQLKQAADERAARSNLDIFSIQKAQQVASIAPQVLAVGLLAVIGVSLFMRR